MSLTIEAIYKNGVLNPIQPIALAKGTHVSVGVITTETPSDPKTPAEILAEIAALPLASNNQGFSNRDHDTVLYSTGDEA